MQTIGIGLDTSLAKQGTEEFFEATRRMREQFHMAEKAAEDFNMAVASIKAEALGRVDQSLQDIRKHAVEATDEVKKLRSEMDEAAKPRVMRLITDGRERIAGLLADLRQFALSTDHAAVSMAALAEQMRRVVLEGGRLQAAQARPALLSGSSPQQLRLAGPVIDIEPIRQASSWFERLKEFASNAFLAIRRFAADQSGAVSIGRIGEMARNTVSGLIGFLTATNQTATATRGAAAAIAARRAADEAAAASAARHAAAMARLGSVTSGAFGMVSAAASGLGSVTSSLANGAFNILRASLGGVVSALGLGTIGVAALSAAFMRASDEATLFNRKLNSIASSPAELSDIRAAVLGIANTTRSSITEIGTDFAKFFGLMRDAGNSIDQTTKLIEGYQLALKIGGASTQEAHRASVQFFQGFAKGKWELQDFKSMLQSSPYLVQQMANAFGQSWPKLYAALKEGGDIAHSAMNTVLTVIAQSADTMKAKFAEMPKTMGESVQGLKNSWFLFVEDVNNKTKFGTGAGGFIDELAEKLRSPVWSEYAANLIKTISGYARGLWNFFADIFGGLTSNFSAFGSFVSSWFGSSVSNAAAFANSFGINMTSTVDFIKSAFKALFDGLFTSLAYLSGAFGALGSAASYALSGEFSKAFETIKNVNSAGMDAVKAFRAQRDAVRETNEALSKQEAIAAFRRSELAGFDMVGKPQIPGLNAPPSVDKDKHKGEDSLKKKLGVLEEENRLTQLIVAGNERQADLERVKLEMARAMTPEQRKQNVELAAQIDAQIRIKEQLRLQAETYNTLKGMFTSIGDTISNNFMRVGEGAMKFRDALKDTLAQMIKIVAQALILKPLIESFSMKAAGSLTSSNIFGDALTKGGGGLLGGMLGLGGNGQSQASSPAASSISPSSWLTQTFSASSPMPVKFEGSMSDTSIPASVRYNNPGAMYPASWMQDYGMTGYGVIGGGHRIAQFPDAVSGGAANFALFDRGYAGKPLSVAIEKWSGGNSSDAYTNFVSKQSGIAPDQIVTRDMLQGDQGRKMLGAMSDWERGGKGTGLGDDGWKAAQDRWKSITDGSADKWKTSVDQSSSTFGTDITQSGSSFQKSAFEGGSSFEKSALTGGSQFESSALAGGSSFEASALTGGATTTASATTFSGEVIAAGATFETEVAAAGATSSASSGMGGLGSLFSGMFLKDGGAFNNGVQFFAAGGVFDGPTSFAHAGGLGVLGEAGPEAVMPLTRMGNGKLGVMSQGGSGGSVVNNFVFNVAGSIDPKVRDELVAEMDARIARNVPVTVKKSLLAVKQENLGNPNYLRRG